jgi:hypothetical protein
VELLSRDLLTGEGRPGCTDHGTARLPGHAAGRIDGARGSGAVQARPSRGACLLSPRLWRPLIAARMRAKLAVDAVERPAMRAPDCRRSRPVPLPPGTAREWPASDCIRVVPGMVTFPANVASLHLSSVRRHRLLAPDLLDASLQRLACTPRCQSVHGWPCENAAWPRAGLSSTSFDRGRESAPTER